MKKILLSFLCLVLAISFVGCGNNKSNVKIPQELELYAKSGLLCVVNNCGKCVFIDKDGKEVVKTEYTAISQKLEDSLKDLGVIILNNDNKYALFNSEGKELISFTNTGSEEYRINDFYEGSVTTVMKQSVDSTLYSVIDSNGKVIVDFTDKFIFGFSKAGYAEFSDKNDKKGIMDKEGKIIVEAQYDSSDDLPKFSNNGLAAKKETNENGFSKWGYINTKSEWVIKPQFKSVQAFQENGLAKVKLEDGYGVIDNTGKVLTEKTYDSIDNYKNGVAIVMADKSYGLINENGKEIAAGYEKIIISSQFAKVKKDNKYGYITLEGKNYLEPKYEDVGKVGANELIAVKENSKWGYVNKSGKFIIEPIYSKAEEFKANGYAVVSKDGKYGLIDEKGEVIIATEYKDAINYNSDGIAAVKVKRSWKFIDKNGKEVLNIDNEGLRSFGGDGYFVASNSTTDGYTIIKNGKIIASGLKEVLFDPNKIS